MKSTALNSLKYTGIVTLSRYTNKKKTPLATLHNEGGYSLFSFLSDCLVGEFDTARLARPTKVMLLNTVYTAEDNDSGQVKKISSASGFIYLMTQPEKVYTDSMANSSTVCYSFIIPRDTIEAAEFNSIGLYADSATLSDVENFAAFCRFPGELKTEISTSNSALLAVDWELNISNK